MWHISIQWQILMITNSVLLYNVNNSTVIGDLTIWTSFYVFVAVSMLSPIEFYICMQMYFWSELVA